MCKSSKPEKQNMCVLKERSYKKIRLSCSNIGEILLGNDHLYLPWVASEGRAKAQDWTLQGRTV